MAKQSKTLTEEELAITKQMEATYQDVQPMRTRDGRFFVIRKCSQVERVRFIDAITPDKKNAVADVAGPNKTYAISVMVHPASQEEKAEIIKDYPFLCEKIVERSIELSEGEVVELGNV